ncbi:type II toxin-antitoxin system PemK/MazF family toxin [Acidiphilium sp. PA]|uniref:type II toxin-antitoxin system PemK/MazF family toxin n=1 Tax=Acidiphilium sp. PA TaxID=2871705 RepID=UPI002243326A|nr:type II toxin-antitoxin system PemK/MazF family toxin [Acidiphilium sp. PA]MCW8305845.1 type II toxin-antitoxin system PemK/MazF family toxin [Acidiphilium sp. PA]
MPPPARPTNGPKRGDDFARHGYVPALGDIIHLDRSPTMGDEMRGPHYGVVLSATLFNQGTGMVMVVPITSKTGKLSGFELPITAGRVKGATILSHLRSLDYQSRSLQFEARLDEPTVTEANRRLRLIFP